MNHPFMCCSPGVMNRMDGKIREFGLESHGEMSAVGLLWLLQIMADASITKSPWARIRVCMLLRTGGKICQASGARRRNSGEGRR